MLLTQRLKRIDIVGPEWDMKKSSVLRSYDLVYASGGQLSVTGRSLLKSVTMNDNTVNHFASTTFDWERGQQGFSRLDSTVQDFFVGNYRAGYRLLDMNGDGFADLFYVIKNSDGKPNYAVRFWEPGHQDFGALRAWAIEPQVSFDAVYNFPQPALSDAGAALGLLMWYLSNGAPGTDVVPIMRQSTRSRTAPSTTPPTSRSRRTSTSPSPPTSTATGSPTSSRERRRRI